MGDRPAYDEIGVGYSQIRGPDRRIQLAVDDALWGAARIVNVGAGTGSYEPEGRCVAAIEPSAVMIGQRAPNLAPAVQARAEKLPITDAAADAALAVHTVMHGSDLGRGLGEMRRVAARAVILTVDPEVIRELWIIKDYAPEMPSTHNARLPSIRDLASAFRDTQVRIVPYLGPEIRRGTSPWHQISKAATDRAVRRLSRDLADGTWDARHGHLRSDPAHDVGMRLVIGG